MYGALPNAVYAARTPPATPSQTIPAAASEPHESPHAAGVMQAQAPAGAINREQIGAAVSGRDCDWRQGIWAGRKT